MRILLNWPLNVLLLASLIVACGKKNKTGSGSEKYFGALGTYSGTSPANVSNPYVSQIFQLTQCMTGGSAYLGSGVNPNLRVGHGMPMSFRVAANATYAGVTAEGDVAVLTSDREGNAVLSLYICVRPGMTANQVISPMMQNPPMVANTLRGCRVDQISAVTVGIPSAAGFPFTLAFFPIHFNPTLRSALCQM